MTNQEIGEIIKAANKGMLILEKEPLTEQKEMEIAARLAEVKAKIKLDYS